MVSPSPITSTGLDTTEVTTGDLTAPDEAVKYALQQVGKPYVWGASGPAAFDCSGLTQAAYASAGVILPRTTYLQVRIGTPVASIADAAPGDLIFPYANLQHVVMYLGNNEIVEAPHPGKDVQVVAYYGAAGGIRRVTDQVGTGAYITSASLATSASGGPPTGAAGQASSLFTALTSGKDWASFGYVLLGGVCLFIVGAQLIDKF